MTLQPLAAGTHRPSLTHYTAPSRAVQRSRLDFDDNEDVLSTDTAEALREAAMKRADTLSDDDLEKAKEPPAPIGLLAIHLLKLSSFNQSATEMDLLSPSLSFKVVLSIGDLLKWTSTKKGITKTIREKEKTHQVLAAVIVDELKHFSVTVPKETSDPKNVLKFEVYAAEDSSQKSEMDLIGTVEVHLHEIIRAMLIIDVIPLTHNHLLVANLEIEFAFMYGCFGFSYSTQLENPGFDPDKDLVRSMFPRVALPELRDGDTLEATPQHAPTTVPWTCPTIRHWNEEVAVQPSEPPPSAPAAFSADMQSGVREILTEYLPLPCRRSRLDFLGKLVRGTPGQEKWRSDAATCAPSDGMPPPPDAPGGYSGPDQAASSQDPAEAGSPTGGDASGKLPNAGAAAWEKSTSGTEEKAGASGAINAWRAFAGKHRTAAAQAAAGTAATAAAAVGKDGAAASADDPGKL